MKFSFPGNRGNLYYSVFAVNLASLSVGTHYSWSSPSLPKLEADDSWLPVNSEEASWVSSLVLLGTTLGPFLGSGLINTVGRRWTIVGSVAISTIAWIIMFFTHSVWQMYIGRFIGGVGGGIAFLACPVYVAEISEPEVRGALGSFFSFFVVGGFVFDYASGPYVSYWILIIINLIPAIMFLLFFPFTPESPYFYLCKKNSESALESLSWLRSNRVPEDIQRELSEIQEEVDRSTAEKAKLSDLFASRGTLMALFLSCAMVGGQQLSGVNVVLFYGQDIFKMARSTITDSTCQIINGSILFAGGALTIPLTRRFGMKNMLIASAVGMAIFQAILGIYFYFHSANRDMTSVGWLPLLSMVCYVLIYTLGFGPLPWAVMAEVFPTKVKGLGSAITTAFCWFLSFLLTKFFTNIVDAFDVYIPFFFFAVCCILSLVITIVFLPDTRNMTLQEIWDLLEKRSKDKTSNGNHPSVLNCKINKQSQS